MAFLRLMARTAMKRSMRGCVLILAQRPKRNSLSATLIAILFSIVFVTAEPRRTDANADSGREYAVKAAFMYNFAKFIEWPADAFQKPNSSFVIGIVGADPFGPILDKAVAGKSIDGHAFVVERLKADQDLRHCHMLFVCPSESDQIVRLISDLRQSPVVTVAETPRFAGRGGIINFMVENDTVRFEINPDAARRAHLTISSKLLGLAHIVKDEKK